MAVVYRALVGIDYPGGRVEAGDTTDGIPAKSVKWLAEQGLIEPVTGKPGKAPRTGAAVDPDVDTTPATNAPEDAATGVPEGSE